MIDNLKFNPDEFENKLGKFPKEYLIQFNEFWEQKLNIESKGLEKHTKNWMRFLKNGNIFVEAKILRHTKH